MSTFIKKSSSVRETMELGRKLGKSLRVIPELEFYIDDSLDYIDKIDKLLHS